MYRSVLISRTWKYVLSNIRFRTATNTSRNVICKNNNFVKPSRLYATKTCCGYDNNRSQETKRYYLAMYMFSLFSYLFHNDEEDEEVSEIVKTLKHSKLLIQKQEFSKAEQMLHVALHQAQTIQHYEAITYIYDVMANLAFYTCDYQKAETLFVTVLKRLISKGVVENDLKVIHISLKIAKIFEMKKEIKKSEQGYIFCIEHLHSHLKEDPEDIEAENMLYITFGWYAQMLVQDSRYTEAYDYFLRSYNICKKIYGDDHEQTAIMFNELGFVCYTQEKYDEAVKYFSAALKIGRKKDMSELCEFLVNLGNTYLRKGLYKEAERFCQEGRKVAKQSDDSNGLHEANVCLNDVKRFL